MKTAWPCAGGDGQVAVPDGSTVVDGCVWCVACESWQPVWTDMFAVCRWRAHMLMIEESVEVRAVRDAELLAVVPDGVREALDRLHGAA